MTSIDILLVQCFINGEALLQDNSAYVRMIGEGNFRDGQHQRERLSTLYGASAIASCRLVFKSTTFDELDNTGEITPRESLSSRAVVVATRQGRNTGTDGILRSHFQKVI
jgi:hypothetical protein